MQGNVVKSPIFRKTEPGPLLAKKKSGKAFWKMAERLKVLTTQYPWFSEMEDTD